MHAQIWLNMTGKIQYILKVCLEPNQLMIILGLYFGRLVYPHMICFEPQSYLSCYLGLAMDIVDNHLCEFIKYILCYWYF